MNKATALRITFILAAVLLAYLPAVWGEFLWDDALYITENPGVRNSDGIKQIWLEPKSSPSPYPLTFTVYWIEHRLWGLNPAGYHLVNIALHAANSILLALALARLRARGNWLAAAIFALHPVHVESVAWITELKDVLSGFFYFLALLAWLSFVDLRRARDYAAVLFFFLAAMLSKSVTCTFPLIALLITVLKLRPRGFGQWRPWLLSSAPLFAIALVFGALTAWWERHETGATAENLSLTLLDRCMIAARAPWFYVGKLIWPSHLMGVYPQWKLSAAPASGWAFLGAACVPGAILLLPRNRSVLLFLCSAFFLLTRRRRIIQFSPAWRRLGLQRHPARS
ncbi:glycosyltransferase family 39 protein [Candidatus Sumerlaeota bacterium]|nr:glycosyltransferase family 39 protein [Candidatus Sumerlaeota bacterium]